MRDLADDTPPDQKKAFDNTDRTGRHRRILLLQGPPSPFWHQLATEFRSAGHNVFKVHLCLSDLLFWRGPNACSYRGSLAQWPDWLTCLIAEKRITDILYYADRLPYHIAAAEVAARAGVRAWVVENGYLRPDWLTVEPVGMSRFSRFSRAPEMLRQAAQDSPKSDLTPRYSHGFWEEAVREVLFGLAITFGRPFYPQYCSDRYYAPLQDYLSWVFRLIQQVRNTASGRAIIGMCETAEMPFNLLAMQLQSDYQIRASSNYHHLSEMLREVIASFAAVAPCDRHLVIKGHPLDNGWENWPSISTQIALEHGVETRVHWIDGGDLGTLIRNSAGVITVNSTVGLLALRYGRPVIALGDAIYDVEGLSHRMGINTFWSTATQPNSLMTRALVQALIAKCQVRGSFHDQSGREFGVREIVQKIEKEDFF